ADPNAWAEPFRGSSSEPFRVVDPGGRSPPARLPRPSGDDRPRSSAVTPVRGPFPIRRGSKAGPDGSPLGPTDPGARVTRRAKGGNLRGMRASEAARIPVPDGRAGPLAGAGTRPVLGRLDRSGERPPFPPNISGALPERIKFAAVWDHCFNGKWHGARPHDRHRPHKPTRQNIGAVIRPSVALVSCYHLFNKLPLGQRGRVNRLTGGRKAARDH